MLWIFHEYIEVVEFSFLMCISIRNPCISFQQSYFLCFCIWTWCLVKTKRKLW